MLNFFPERLDPHKERVREWWSDISVSFDRPGTESMPEGVADDDVFGGLELSESLVLSTWPGSAHSFLFEVEQATWRYQLLERRRNWHKKSDFITPKIFKFHEISDGEVRVWRLG
jgi:hypothetical protein